MYLVMINEKPEPMTDRWVLRAEAATRAEVQALLDRLTIVDPAAVRIEESVRSFVPVPISSLPDFVLKGA